MKRSRRVVLTLMGSAALGAVSKAVEARPFDCGPGMTAMPGPDGRPYCRPISADSAAAFIISTVMAMPMEATGMAADS